eukprot:tig00000179_g13061.t1
MRCPRTVAEATDWAPGLVNRRSAFLLMVRKIAGWHGGSVRYVPKPLDYIDRLAARIGLSGKEREAARERARALAAAGSGRSPVVLAAAAICAATGLPHDAVAGAAGITACGVRKGMAALRAHLSSPLVGAS